MTFVDDAVRDGPVSLYLMDDSSPFQDYSGYNRVASSTSTAVQHSSLVAGATYSQTFDNANVVTYDTSVSQRGRERFSFSLEAWVKVVSGTGNQQVLGNTGVDDGIWINGNVISFVLKFATAPEARITYDAQIGQTFHVVAIKTSDKIILYVNGVVTSELSLTEAQKADIFASTPGTMGSGRSSGTQKIALNAVALYSKEITPEVINRHYAEGMRGLKPTEVSATNGGLNIPTTLDNADLFIDFLYDTAEDWNTGTINNVFVRDDKLIPQFDGTTSMAGTWTITVPLTQANTNSIYGVTLDWYGSGATVKTSLDGTTWTTAVRGVALPSIPSGYNPTDKLLFIEVSFPGGIVDDTSYLDNLNVIGFRTGLPLKVGGRQVTLTKAYQRRDFPVRNFNEGWGTVVESGGSMAISADTSPESSVIRTLEVWIKMTSASNPFLSTSAAAQYFNGVAAGPWVQGAWALWHVVLSADSTTGITISGPAQIGAVNLYNTVLSATEIANIHKQYINAYSVQVLETNVVAVAEPAQSAILYAHDWSIQSSG